MLVKRGRVGAFTGNTSFLDHKVQPMGERSIMPPVATASYVCRAGMTAGEQSSICSVAMKVE